MPALSPNILLIAQSARMPAQLAVQAGFRPVTIDVYADLDTRQLAQACISVNSLALADLQTALAHPAAQACSHLVYGSGFEQYLQSLAYLEQHWQTLGNSAAMFERLQDKPAFFQHLAALNIPHPPTQFTTAPPFNQNRWLYKPALGQGGIGVHFAADGAAIPADKHGYWQQYIPGLAMSLTFIVAGDRLWPLGLNRQWSQAQGDEPFRFAGIANAARLPADAYQQLLQQLQQLLAVYPLQGLGSLDFIWLDGVAYWLEINPRIPASALLYSEQVFNWHVQACQNAEVNIDSLVIKPAAYQLIYAAQPTQIPAGVNWPKWAHDLPPPGAIIGKGQPICSIIAHAKAARQVHARLRHQQQFIENLLNTGR